MSTETTNLGLKKPDANDFYNVQDFNDNADLLDAAIAGKANSSHDHNASDIASGTLPLARGGTGQTSLANVKSAFGITALENNFANLIDEDTIQAAENAGILSGGGLTLLNEILQLCLANAVTEEYDDGIWHVKKYANGEAEIRGTYITEKEYAITTVYGSLFMFPAFAISLPIRLVDATKSQASVSISGDGGDIAGQVRLTDDEQYTNIIFAWMNATAYTAKAGKRIQYIVKGKWK